MGQRLRSLCTLHWRWTGEIIPTTGWRSAASRPLAAVDDEEYPLQDALSLDHGREGRPGYRSPGLAMRLPRSISSSLFVSREKHLHGRLFGEPPRATSSGIEVTQHLSKRLTLTHRVPSRISRNDIALATNPWPARPPSRPAPCASATISRYPSTPRRINFISGQGPGAPNLVLVPASHKPGRLSASACLVTHACRRGSSGCADSRSPAALLDQLGRSGRRNIIFV